MLNNLWKPTNSEPKEKQKPPKDELCQPCPNFKICKGLCPPMCWINGRAETKELIPSQPIISHGIELQDYNESLAEMITDQQARDIDRLETIRSIKDLRIRLIAAGVLVYVPQVKIAEFANISQGMISKLYCGHKR